MIQITPHMRIFVAHAATDFRCQIPGLEAICRLIFNEDPMSGAVFVFKNRSANSIKMLFFDGDGFWCCQRKLAKGNYKWWPKGEGYLSTVDAQELIVLIWNGDPRGVFNEPWKRLKQVDDGQGKYERKLISKIDNDHSSRT